jgi:hypothetical protein
MKPETKLDRQAKALFEFQRTLRRTPERFCWREPWTEPATHYWMRICDHALWRCRLTVRAGLEFDGLRDMLRRFERRASAARRAWKKEDRREREEFLMSRTAMMEGLIPLPGESEGQR